MRAIFFGSCFKRDFKKICNNARALALVKSAIFVLASEENVPARLREHALGGKWSGCLECHVAPDLLLVYEKNETTLTLVRLGSHSELF